MAGLSKEGFQVKRLPEILSDIENAERQNIDPTLSTAEDTILGQLNNIYSYHISLLWELAEAVNDNFNIAKAEGKNLDDLATLRNVSRIKASKSSTDSQWFTGVNGATIPAGSLFSNPITGDEFSAPGAVITDSGSCISATLSVQNVLNSTEYSITVNGVEYTYTSTIAATKAEIVNAFVTEITNDTEKTWTATANGTDLIIATDDNDNPIDVQTTTYISIDSVTVVGALEAVEFGDIVAPAGAITNVVTVIPGLISTTNAEQLRLGRGEETDEELRIRIASASNSDCTGTIPSIQTAIVNNVEGVTSAIATENTTAVTDGEGRPPHSVEIVVVGGTDANVAQEIWRTKPAGIALHGNTSQDIQDSNGNIRTIKFTRATAVHFAVRVTYTLYDEEVFPATGSDLIKAAVLEYINDLIIGVDVIPNRLYGPIYSAVDGIEDLTVEIQTLANPGDTPDGGSWQTTKVPISSSQFASTVLADITTVDAT